MSSPAEELLTSEFSVERRFYQRTAPSAFVGVNLGDDNPAMLLNLSENGLLVATPNLLAENFVCRASLLLSGLLRPIEVLVRVVWTTGSKRAGIQMLDLCEYDREQIRKWAALEEARRETAFQTAEAEDRTEVPEPEPAAATSFMETPEEETTEEAADRSKSDEAVAQKRRSALIPLAVCAGSVLVLFVMGAAVWASPLRPWLARSIGDVAKYAKGTAARATVKSQDANEVGQLPTSGDARGQNIGEQAAGVSEASPVNSAGNERAPADGATKEALDSTAAMTVNGAATSPAKTSLSGSVSEKKAAGKRAPDSNAKQLVNSLPGLSEDVVTSSAVDAATKQASEETVTRGDDAKKNTPEGAATQNATNGSSATDQSDASRAVVSTPAGNTAVADPRTSRTAIAAAASIAPSDASKPSVVQTENPKSQMYEITLPNSTRPSFLSLPGERVVQSDGVTLHLQRSILTPPGAGWWSGERKKKVVVGDLVTRIDPRLPHQAQAADVRVSVRAILGKDGHVERLMPVNGPVTLVSSVTRAVREWTFQPTLVDGKAVETAVLVLVEFHGPTSAAASH